MTIKDNRANQPLGQILIEAGLISIPQIELALQEQEESGLKIGEILIDRGWIELETVDFFVEQWHSLINAVPKKPLIYYFQAASLLNVEQINSVIRLQKLKHKKVRFHRLAVEQGYLKQNTVDFFLTHLFKIHDPKSISAAKPYEIIMSYSQGIKDFSGSDLQKAPMMGISLKGIIFDGSNLSYSDLSQANLSNSSLIRVNLNSANLTKVILTGVNLTNSFLIEADLTEARLENTNFNSANLQGANLQRSYLAQADFSGADLTQARLPLDYPDAVYYDRDTIFDHDFDPQLVGWKQIDN